MNRYSFIASKIASNRVVNSIAWISVSLSIAIMLVAICVVDGFKKEIGEKAAGFMGSVVLTIPGTSPVNDLYPQSEILSFYDDLEGLDCVESIDGVAYKSGMIKNGNDIYGLYFKGVDSLYNFSFFDKCLEEGAVPHFNGRISNDVMISRRTAEALGYKVGDEMIAYFVGEEVRVRKFNVSAIFDAQLEDIDKTMAIADIRQVRRICGWGGDDVSSIEIRLAQGVDVDNAVSRIQDVIYEKSTEDDPAYFVTDIRQIFGHLFDWLALLDLNVLMILALMMIVAGFNMISAILIILFEKISMIGLLKALGMDNRQVGKVFMLRAWKIVWKGLLLGTAIGLAICLIQYYTHILTLNPDNYFVKFVPISFNVFKISALEVVSAIVIMAIISISTVFISKISPSRTMRVK